MTWTYDDALTANKDKVRFYVGDVDSADQLVSDEEITFALAEEGSVRSASALICEHLAAKYARYASSEVGDLKIEYTERYEQLRDTAAALRASSAVLAIPVAGGISIARKDTVEADTDRVPPAFTVDLLSHPDQASTIDARDRDD